MLNFRRSDELRRAKTTESTAAVTPRQLQFGVRPRSSTGRDEEQELQHTRMPDLQPRPPTRARGMSGGCVDALRRAIAVEHERAEAVKSKQQQQRPRANTTATRSSFQHNPRLDQIAMETKRVMVMARASRGGASVSGKDRDLPSGGYEKRGRRDVVRDPSDPNSGKEDEEQDEVMQELQMRPTESLAFVPMDDHRALAAGATSYEHEYEFEDPEFDLIDDYDDDDDDEDLGCYMVDTPELAAFLSQQPQQQQHQAYPPPMFPKAASFSGQHYIQYYQSQQHHQNPSQQPQFLRGLVPCSPPVPIPPKQMLRRRNSVTGSLLTTNPMLSTTSRKYGGGDVLCGESNYSRTQCEARLWDEDWNFKLSLEARESFEAANNNSNSKTNRNSTTDSNSNSTSANGRAVWKPQSTSSIASTADTFRDEDEDFIGFGGLGFNNDSGDEDEDDADQVFDMDDL